MVLRKIKETKQVSFLTHRKLWFNTRCHFVGFVADKMTLEEAFLRDRRYFPVIIIPQKLHIHLSQTLYGLISANDNVRTQHSQEKINKQHSWRSIKIGKRQQGGTSQDNPLYGVFCISFREMSLN